MARPSGPVRGASWKQEWWISLSLTLPFALSGIIRLSSLLPSYFSSVRMYATAAVI
jgi:hypothetical protein